MKNDDVMPGNNVTGDVVVSAEDEKKGKIYVLVSLCLAVLLVTMFFILHMDQTVIFLVGGVIYMANGVLHAKGLKLLKKDTFGNLPIWEFVFGAVMALMSLATIFLL